MQIFINLLPLIPSFCRTDAQSHDISELYQFADQTGVLDRHKQLLSQPFNNNQVREVVYEQDM